MKVYEWEVQTVNSISSLQGQSAILDMTMFSLSSILIGGIGISILLIYLFIKDKQNTKKLSLKIFIAFIIADFTSRFLFKYLFLRPRPNFLKTGCYDSHCYGFISSHASDIFAISTVLIITNKKNSYWTIPLAIAVCFSRLYLKDHFPLDLIGGAFVGILAGFSGHLLVQSFKKNSFI